ncbi:hypothetical protein KVV02_004825 [Mortierella alpina]|uniref:CMP/dCMP-type deaminase domain-containing protein n=1 Tax=Mortierella alpina TaxID=64518 RepID=A0A9P8D1G7_MORAP|nr:hypothetical protein KVV02_004825 [Mortierella alpina]
MATPQPMKVLSKEDNEYAMHIHFMKLAIEQANLSVPVPSGYCVGAVLVQETHPDPDSDLPQVDRFRVVATGYSRELPGNTHAEECCLIKLAAAAEEEAEKELDAGLVADDDDDDDDAVDGEEGGKKPTGMAGIRRLSVQNQNQHHQHPHAAISALRRRRSSVKLRQEWIMYSTMEPCSTRLSGNRACADLLIESGVRRVYVGVREPDHFVKTVVGVEKMVERGMEVVHIPGFEDLCLAPNQHVLSQ